MKDYKKVFKLFLAGQEEKETEWLSQMSKKGYHLVNVNFATYYIFRKDTPKKYTYIIDMKENSSLNDEEYKLMYLDYGLEYIDNSNRYYYFRGDEHVETSKIIENEQGRYLDRLNSQIIAILFAAILNLVCFGFNVYNFEANKLIIHSWSVFLNLGIGLFCLFVYLKIKIKIKCMRKSGVKEAYKTKLKDWDFFYKIVFICISYIILLCFATLVSYFI